MSNNIAVSITADVADLQVKRAIMSAELKAATKDLNTFAKEAASSGSTDALREGMLSAASAAATAKAGIAGINAELKGMEAVAVPAAEHVEHGFAGATVSIREMGIQLRESVAAVGEMREAMIGFGEVMIAAFAIERIAEWGAKFGENAEQVKHLADEFGLSIEQVQKLQGVALGTGTPLETLVKGMSLLDKNTATASGSTNAMGKALAIVGISANDGRSQMERLAIVADKFSSLSAGPERLALAMTLFGRNGREMIPVLEQGSKGIEELSAKAEALGMVSEAANEKGQKLAEAINTSKIAWEGLKNTLGDAFAETLTQITEGFVELVQEMVQSYNQGGAMRDIFDAIVISAKVMGETVQVLGAVIATLYDHLSLIVSIAGGFAAVMAGKWAVSMASAILSTAELRIALTGLIGVFEAGGIVAAFSALIGGLTAGMRAMAVATMEATAAMLANPWTWLAAAVAGAIELYQVYTEKTLEQITAENDLRQAKDTLANAEDNLAGKSRDALMAMKAETSAALDLAAAHLKTAQAALVAANAEAQTKHREVEDTQAGSPYADAMGAEGASMMAVDSSFAQHQAAKARDAYLTQKKAVDDLQASIDKLNAAIKTAPPSTGDLGLSHTPKPKKEKEPKSRMSDWEEKLAQEKLAIAEMVDQDGGYHEMSLAAEAAYWNNILKRADLSHEERLSGEKKYYSLRLAMLTAQAQAEDASIRSTLAIKSEATRTETELAKIALQQKLAAIDAEERAGKISAVAATQARATLNAQLYQLDADQENRLYELNHKALQDEIAVQGQTDKQKDALRRQDEALQAQHLNRMRLLNAQTQQKVQQDNQKTLDAERAQYATMARTFGDAIAKMVTFQRGLNGTINDLWKSLLGGVEQSISKMLQTWLTSIAMGESAEIASNIRLTVGNAKAAAAAAYKAVAGIPFVGPILAPIAAATAFAGVMAFSAEDGMDRVPYDGATIIAHKDEMILSARYANPLRDMLTNGAWGMPSGIGALGALPSYALPAGLSGGYQAPAANTNSRPASNDGEGTAGGSGGLTVHIHAVDGESVKRLFLNHGDALATGIKAAHRKGRFSGTGLNF